MSITTERRAAEDGTAEPGVRRPELNLASGFAEVVAGHVGPKPVEFFIAETQRLAQFLAEQGVIAGRDPDRRKRFDRRVDDQPNPGVDAVPLACEPESFDIVDPDGSEIEHPRRVVGRR